MSDLVSVEGGDEWDISECYRTEGVPVEPTGMYRALKSGVKTDKLAEKLKCDPDWIRNQNYHEHARITAAKMQGLRVHEPDWAKKGGV